MINPKSFTWKFATLGIALVFSKVVRADPVAITKFNIALGPGTWIDRPTASDPGGKLDMALGPTLFEKTMYENTETIVDWYRWKLDGIAHHKCTFGIVDKSRLKPASTIFVVQAVVPYLPGGGDKQENGYISMDCKLVTH